MTAFTLALKLLILTQYFPPEMGAPQARLSELGEQLIELGWEVEALTALPNYPTGRVFPPYARPTAVLIFLGKSVGEIVCGGTLVRRLAPGPERGFSQ
jgi:hypothetical protein